MVTGAALALALLRRRNQQQQASTSSVVSAAASPPPTSPPLPPMPPPPPRVAWLPSSNIIAAGIQLLDEELVSTSPRLLDMRCVHKLRDVLERVLAAEAEERSTASLGLAARICDAATGDGAPPRSSAWLLLAQSLLERLIEFHGDACLAVLAETTAKLVQRAAGAAGAATNHAAALNAQPILDAFAHGMAVRAAAGACDDSGASWHAYLDAARYAALDLGCGLQLLKEAVGTD